MFLLTSNKPAVIIVVNVGEGVPVRNSLPLFYILIITWWNILNYLRSLEI